MIELGGNIKLVNFEGLEPALLIVVKKVVGNYTKKISESLNEFKSIEVTLVNKENNEIKVKVEANKSYESNAKDKNLFFALDKCLSVILKE
ncbi:MAG: hypothetical protein AABW46_01720 [Nanoarchaeota archaeon]